MPQTPKLKELMLRLATDQQFRTAFFANKEKATKDAGYGALLTGQSAQIITGLKNEHIDAVLGKINKVAIEVSAGFSIK